MIDTADHVVEFGLAEYTHHKICSLYTWWLKSIIGILQNKWIVNPLQVINPLYVETAKPVHNKEVINPLHFINPLCIDRNSGSHSGIRISWIYLSQNLLIGTPDCSKRF